MDAETRRRAEEIRNQFSGQTVFACADELGQFVADAVAQAVAERDAEMLQELHVRDVTDPCPTHEYLHCGICAERDRQQLLVQHQALKQYEEEAVRRYDTAEEAVNRQMIEIAQQAEEINAWRVAQTAAMELVGQRDEEIARAREYGDYQRRLVIQCQKEIMRLRAALEYIRYNCQVRTKTAAVAKIIETLDDLGIATATPSPPIEPTPEAQGERA